MTSLQSATNFILAYLLLLSCTHVSVAESRPANQTGALVAWNSPEGRLRLDRSRCKEDFYALAQYFQPQANPLYCGVASAVIVLNALRAPHGVVPSQSEMEVRLPAAMGGNALPFCSYSQASLLNDATDAIKPASVIALGPKPGSSGNMASDYNPGLTLEELAGVLRVHGLRVAVQHAGSDHRSLELFRRTLQEVLADDTRFLIANFHGTTMGSRTGGHISPLAAYDGQSDSVLTLDVAGHKQYWHWAKLESLHKAMDTLDGKSKRGWLVVSEGLDKR